MKIFISWSGNLRSSVAHELRTWLPSIIQSLKPYYTPQDIEKGARWSTEIASELNSASIGIICLTRDNLDAPWILFEAGALSKQLDAARICPVLFGISPTDVQGPLAQFQATPFDKSEMRKLVGSINSLNKDNRLEPSVIDEAFDVWWPRLESRIASILNTEPTKTTGQIRSDRELLEEVLHGVRLLNQTIGKDDAEPNDEEKVQNEEEQLLQAAVRIVFQHQRVSISLVQRHLRIGYNRASHLIQEMENRGVVTSLSADGSRSIVPGVDAKVAELLSKSKNDA